MVERYEAEEKAWAADVPECAVILVSYNGAAYLARCLESLRAQTYRDFDVILIDNASSDDTLAVARVEAHGLPRVTIVPLQQNTGFAGGNSLALQYVSRETRFVVLLNTDAFPEPEWLGRLVAAADQDPRVGLTVGKILDAADPSRIDSCGDVLNLFGAPCSRGRGLPSDCFNNDEDVFGGCAAALLIRASALRELGYLFDESLFTYNEDVDLAYRVQTRGYRCRYVADAVVHHLRSAASPGREAWRHAISRRNMWIVFMRYSRTRPLKVLLFVLYWLAGDAKLLLTGRAAVVWSEYRMLLFGTGIRS